MLKLGVSSEVRVYIGYLTGGVVYASWKRRTCTNGGKAQIRTTALPDGSGYLIQEADARAMRGRPAPGAMGASTVPRDRRIRSSTRRQCFRHSERWEPRARSARQEMLFPSEVHLKSDAFGAGRTHYRISTEARKGPSIGCARRPEKDPL